MQTGGQRYRLQKGKQLASERDPPARPVEDACGFRLLARFRRRRMEAQQLVDSRAGGCFARLPSQ